jgi:hypothetical protein
MAPYGQNRELALCDLCGHPKMAHFGGACHCGCTGARTLGGNGSTPKAVGLPASDETSTAEVQMRPTTALVDDLVERVRSAVFSSTAHRRGWDGVRAAALLRRQGEHERALQLLDDVVARFEYPDIVSAAYACAVAVHCDRGDPATGIKVGRSAWIEEPSPGLGNALARAYWEEFERTGDDADREAWARFKEGLVESVPSAARAR